MNGTKQTTRYATINEYIQKNGFKKSFIAKRWGISRFHMTAILYPGRYYFTLTDEQVAAIAADLNQTPEFVRNVVLNKAA